MARQIFNVEDKVRVTLESDRNHKREGVIKRGTLEAHPHQYYLVTFDDSSEGEWYQVDLLELAKPTTEHDTTVDTAQAVIEAARAVLKHVDTEIRVPKRTGKAELWISFVRNDTRHIEVIDEGDDEPPDTLLGTLAGLVAAMDAHDAKSDNLTLPDTE